jgi:hypothetical protein
MYSGLRVYLGDRPSRTDLAAFMRVYATFTIMWGTVRPEPPVRWRINPLTRV